MDVCAHEFFFVVSIFRIYASFAFLQRIVCIIVIKVKYIEMHQVDR